MGECVFYGTELELAFIRKLGAHLDNNRSSWALLGLSKEKLLNNYINALKNRRRWGNINAEQVYTFAHTLYKEITGAYHPSYDSGSGGGMGSKAGGGEELEDKPQADTEGVPCEVSQSPLTGIASYEEAGINSGEVYGG